MDKRPSVLPTPEQMASANETGELINEQLEKENEINPTEKSSMIAQEQAASEMKKRTDEQLRLRDEQFKKNEEMANKAILMDEKRQQGNNVNPNNFTVNGGNVGNQQPAAQPPQQPPQQPPSNNDNGNHDYYGGDHYIEPSSNDQHIEAIMQPQMNQPFDLIPLPSEGKFYPGIKKSVKVAYLTTADENILTSPNLVESGDFLEILINRKLLEPGLRYNDLLPGDRNAIMIWLRATGYGEVYPISIYDENGESFDTDINLSELKTINLNVDPNAQGLYEYTLPLTKNVVKFRLLTVGDLDKLQEIVDNNKENLINEEATMLLENQIVEVNGNKDRNFIKDYTINMRVLDAQGLREYMGSISCGIDMNIEVQSPGGETIKTFLPLTPRFFWPNSEL